MAVLVKPFRPIPRIILTMCNSDAAIEYRKLFAARKDDLDLIEVFENIVTVPPHIRDEFAGRIMESVDGVKL